jgi:hypothetical protein
LARTIQYRGVAQLVPKYGTIEEMNKMSLDQFRQRLAYQKELMAAKPTHSPEHEIDEIWRWVNLSIYVGLPAILMSLIYSFGFEVHPHREEGDLPDYMKIRSKEYPWRCGECDLFDYPCWEKCKANMKK